MTIDLLSIVEMLAIAATAATALSIGFYRAAPKMNRISG